MRNPLFTDSQFEKMALEVRKLLKEVGYKVDHDGVKEMAVKAGCRLSVKNRVLFRDSQIDELAVRLHKLYGTSLANDTERTLVLGRKKTETGFGNIVPKYYNYKRGSTESGSIENLTDMMKFAHCDPRITNITLPVSREDIVPELEQIDSILRMVKLTYKQLGPIDITTPEAVPLFEAIAEILGLKPNDFIGPCNCINPPMHLGVRTAETMLQRKRFHGTSMITPMPSLGGSGPVDIYGCIILGTAEVVGGLILSMIIDSEAPLLGYIAAGQLDMRTTVNTQSSPQSIRLDSGVYQLMEKCFGGGTKVGGRTYVSARRPGIQAMFEKMMKMIGYSSYVDANSFWYAGSGVIDNGSTISPEQFLLDLEITDAFNWLWTSPEVPIEENDAFTRIRDEIDATGGNFLTSDHTLYNYRNDLWDPRYFMRLTQTRDEAEILEKCHSDYMKSIEKYSPASYPDHVVNEIERIYMNAKVHFNII